MPMVPHPTLFGVFRPVDHIVISFATAADQGSAAQQLLQAHFEDVDVYRYTPMEMQQQAEGDIENATTLASIGQDLNLVKAHLELAKSGQSFLVVHAQDTEDVDTVTKIAVRCGATRAQRYGSLIVEELIRADANTVADLMQRPESPETGLDDSVK